MKIIDFEKKGNVVRFYLGNDECDNYWGDDWNDRPYEHNAGEVYDDFVSGIIDVSFPFAANVLEPGDDYRYNGNSPYCKEDFQKRHAPCIIVIPEEVVKSDYLNSDSYAHYVGSEAVERFYYNDPVERILNCPLVTVLQQSGKEEKV